VGADNVAMEALIFGSAKLYVHISLLFSLYVRHGHVPDSLTQSFMVPLVKNKAGNLSDINNYTNTESMEQSVTCTPRKSSRTAKREDTEQLARKTISPKKLVTHTKKRLYEDRLPHASSENACKVHKLKKSKFILHLCTL